MSSLSADRKTPLDYGVQIRFIKDLDDSGGGLPDKSRLTSGVSSVSNGTPSPSKYGVAVRVQGISGQPYVVLQDQEKGDSYGVQLKTQQTQNSTPIISRTSPYSTMFPGQREGARTPQDLRSGQASSPDEDFASPIKRPPGDGQAVNQGEVESRTTERLNFSTPPPKVENKVNDDYNEAGLRKVKQNGVGSTLNGAGLNGPTASLDGEPAQAIDTKSLAPINKLISRFGGGNDVPTSDTRSVPRFDNRVRSQSMDALSKPNNDPTPISPTFNPYASVLPATAPKLSSSKPLTSNVRQDSMSAAKVPPAPNFKPPIFNQSPKLFVPKEPPPAVPKKPVTPDLLKSQSLSTEIGNGEDAQTKQAIYNILKEGSIENETAIKRKVSLIHERFCGVKGPQILVTDSNVKTELESALNKNAQFQQMLDKTKMQLLETQDQLVELRMDRERAESRLRQQEDELAHLQEELRRISENSPQSDTLQLDLVTVQAELSESLMLRQKVEDNLRQRERELTALKGALKDEVESHDKEMEALREQYSQDMEALRHSMETVSQSQLEIEEERHKVNDSILALEEELESYKGQSDHWKGKFTSVNQELLQAQQDKKNLEEKLLTIKNQTDETDSNSLKQELQRCENDLKKARSELDKQKAETAKKEEELISLTKSSEGRVNELQIEINRLKDQSKKDKEELEKALEKIQQTSTSDSPHIIKKIRELEDEITRQRERNTRMTRLQSSIPDSSSSDALEVENRSLRNQLEEARRTASRLGQEKEEINLRLEEREKEREALRRGRGDLEEQKRLLDRALEKMNKEMETMMGDSRQSVQVLQSQLEEYKANSKRDLQDAQRLAKERLMELQRSQALLKTAQEEVSRLKKDLSSCSEERDSAQLDKDLLSSRLQNLETELETKKSYTDHSREIRQLEDRVKTLGIELDEERSGTDLLNERIARGREQVDQLRSELMQERSARHDLEMDKSGLERQVKELKSRLADVGTQTRSTAGVTMLESKVQELEDRLRSEEREKSTIMAAQKRLDRKLKDVTATLDQERNQHAEQRDQLSLRVKALKRQLDDSEAEVERLEGIRRKVLRELEEHRELQEVLQAKVNALDNELKRKIQQSRRPTLGSTLSSEEEEGYSESRNIASILTETPLQTTNC